MDSSFFASDAIESKKLRLADTAVRHVSSIATVFESTIAFVSKGGMAIMFLN